MKKIIEVIQNNLENYTPIWLMRQAGRYLPEYREIRGKTSSFLEMCYTPELAKTVTLQPIKRFDFDAAIIFSDILVVPQAMGVDLRFEEGVGPILGKCNIESLNESVKTKLEPVYEAISMTRAELDQDKALIGFAGAPWTLASYIIEQGSSKDFQASKTFMVNQPEQFALIMAKLEKAVASHLIEQIKAGADMVQLFDSWAGALNAYEFRNWVIAPAARIVKQVKDAYPNIPFIGFPKGAGVLYKEYAINTGIDVIGVDQNMPIEWVRDNLAQDMKIQGNLDPIYLLSEDKDLIKREINRIKNTLAKPFIFNLGHGILPATPLENVQILVDMIRGKRT